MIANPVMPSRPIIPTSMLGLLVPLATHRRKARFDEVDLVDTFPAGFERLPHRQVHGFKMRFEQREVLAREARQNPIGRHGSSFGAAERELPEADGLVDAGRDVPSGRSILSCAARTMIG